MKSGRFKNICTSVAGSVGTGNVAGVALCIEAGGPGAVAWLWISALAGMALKSAEVRLGIRFGGPMGYMGQRTAALFAFLTAAASFAVGNAVQASAMTEALRPAGAGFIVPLLLPIAAYALGHSGALRDRTLSVLTPLMAVFYLGGAWYVTMRSADGIPAAIGAIFREALTPRAAIAGLTKGLMSHEAGLGTAALAHSDGAGKPVDGAIEVAADTFLVSTATAMMLLATGGRTPLAALSCLPFARGFLTAAVLLFAFSSVLSWQSYGEKCAEHLGIDRRTYDIVFCVCLAPFSLAPLASAAAVSDIVNIILAAVNVTAMAKWALKKRRS